ncbi:uncharacterized protein LOC134833832 [Culicoides brevitarsis]|uniref:uncharacterized protein LOC134833832 n=1 Tax=Culicoides brevitarsis TaxID=469753 RepID=UPI00307B61AB
MLNFRTTILFVTFVITIHAQSRHKRRNFGQTLNRPRTNEPNYVFILPENKTVVLRKSDFDHVIYPNVTNVNKFVKNKKIVKDLEHSESAKKDFYDNSEEELENIVKQNIQTERNFVNFIEEMNQDLNSEEVKAKHKKSRKEFKKKSETKRNEWDDLGLDGWEGAIAEEKRKNNNTKHDQTSYEIEIYTDKENIPPPYQHHLPSSTPSSKPTKKRLLPPGSQEITEDLPKELQLLIQEERELFELKHGRTPDDHPQWPITSSRDAHKDEDVFIARANNPFGHSTKWKYSNSTAHDENSTSGSRSKRGAVHLYSMIKCATGCDPLVFKGYGCYCGFLGSGYALDGIDRCCKMHDYCYETAQCPSFLEYFVPYLWKCYRGKPVCAYDHGEYGGPNSCAARLCECDLILAQCLRRYYCPHKRNVCVSNPLRLIQNLAMVF